MVGSVGQLLVYVGEVAQFLIKCLEQVESLLCLIVACRSGDWETYLARDEYQVLFRALSPELCASDASPSSRNYRA